MFGYGIGHIGQGTVYNFMSTYFVLFLTNCVGVSSSLAGTISSLALLVEVMMGMIVGNLSDRCTSRMGRRRPFILTAALTMPPIVVLLMHTVHLGKTATFIYYLCFSMLFRVVFATYEIPNNAFGVEIATGYDERTKLRTMTRAIAIIGNGIGYIAPLVILELFADQGDEAGWQAIGITVAGVVFAAWMIAAVTTRGHGLTLEKSSQTKQKHMLRHILHNYYQLSKLKTMKLLIIYKAAFACAFALYNTGNIYYLKYSIGIDNRYTSYIYAFTITIFFIMTPIINKMALKMGKANQQKSMMTLAGVSGIAIYLIRPSSLVSGVLYVALFSVAQTSFWQISNSIFYDVVEVDEYVNDQRREGDIMSLVSVLGTLVTAIMVQLFGIVLDIAGYQPELAVQSTNVVSVLNAVYILVPSLCLLVSSGALHVFPINKKTFASLQKALEVRRNGGDESPYTEDIRKILG